MVKGIQTYEDAALCAQHGVEAIYLSNHGESEPPREGIKD